jgi:predicted metal-binding membrane protein
VARDQRQQGRCRPVRPERHNGGAFAEADDRRRLVAFAALDGTGRLVTASPAAAKWLGAGIFIAAGGYQLTPWKDWCLRRCRSPVGALMCYASFKGQGRDLRVGVHHGATCAGCCWGLMVLLVVAGVLAIWFPWLLPGLHASGMPGMALSQGSRELR